jgi:superfamily II RNA helicase
MSVHHMLGECPEGPKQPALTFKYQVDHFQNHAFNAMERGDHVLVTAHTGSGKTTVAEYAIAHGIRDGRRVIYTAPIKALSNQIFGDFSRKYPHWSIGIRTGDIDFRSDDAQIVIMTTEILLNMLYRRQSDLEIDKDRLSIDFNDVSTVIFDEVHYIKDHDRGSVWERSILMMPKHIQMVMLSATLPDADQFCQWIATCKGVDVTHTTTPFRAVPLTHYVMTGSRMVTVMDSDGKFNDLAYRTAMGDYSFIPSQLDRYIGRMSLPALFFCFSKKHCQTYATAITACVTSSEERMQIQRDLDRLIRKFPNHEELSRLDQTREVFRLAVAGVCYHHAGLIPPLKEIIQELFSTGLIKVLFVTETFAAGVNMPAKTVVFTGLTKYDDYKGGFRILLPEEYGQMAGRAGRRGMDTIGTVIHLPFNVQHHPDQSDIKEMMCGKIRNIESRIRPDYHHVFNSILYETDILSSGSMQERDNKGELAVAREEYRVSLAEKTDAMSKLVLLEAECDEEFYEKLGLYRDFQAGKLKPKAIKRYYSSGMDEWYTSNAKLCSDLTALEAEVMELNSRCSELERIVSNLETGVRNELQVVTQFLHSNGYLREAKDLHEYGPDDLTLKGVMASGVNEANCILLTELVVENYLDDLDCHELVAILGLFLESGDTERELNLPSHLLERLNKIAAYADKFAVAESKYSCCFSDWVIHQEFCDMAYWWSKSETGNIGLVYSQTGSEVQVGEFVKMMLKLNNVCREALRAAQIGHKDQLAIRLRECQGNLVKGVVFPQSLYVTSSK